MRYENGGIKIEMIDIYIPVIIVVVIVIVLLVVVTAARRVQGHDRQAQAGREERAQDDGR